jgi:hypothetical protein
MFGDVLLTDVLISLVGLPLIAAAGCRLLVGREPEVIASSRWTDAGLAGRSSPGFLGPASGPETPHFRAVGRVQRYRPITGLDVR